MTITARVASRWLVTSLALGMATTACDDQGILNPNDTGAFQFSQPITLGELDAHLGDGPARVEIKLQSEGLVAREVEIETSDELFDDEKLEFAILDIDGDNGTLVLDFADLVVQFNGSTEFEGFDGEDMTLTEFVAFVRQELDDGRRPGVEAKRGAPAEPQDPDSDEFVATKLELENVDDRKIEMNVDTDNLTVNDPDAVLRVLGRDVELRLGDGTTELEREDDDLDDEIKFKDYVASTGNDAFTLQNGLVIRLVVGVTEIEDEGEGNTLRSLAEVQQALDDGFAVKAKGEGILDPDNAGTLIAVEVRFKIKREDEDISLGELAAILDAAPARVEIELVNGGLVVRELEIESDDDDEDDEEKIEAQIVAIDDQGTSGSITLNIGGLVVDFDGNTEFENLNGDDMTMAAFVAFVDSELQAGRNPSVEAKRPTPSSPQAPDDGSFLATSLELEDDDDEREIEMHIGGDNLTVNDPRPADGPDATVQVLGVTLELRVTEGVTEIELER